ncbi:Demethylrebeccamycin-D-glucose O-methyltransferase [Rubripirellula amarantea]|uniref:Demethylrebeccamycin-D-glucose O-methyltransferase n=1 Tax=Rubripirellula amarantea TaxID=2527999 RepID=A0A5C5WRQ8_9BACT|nr:class I SAM-dependent methyltransferase [Rubripirellula amarantea]TWT52502.1 Demethylrebeccamycin-D-glucose O-methyltransferase [Rubripirellula amarantea]
MNLHRIPEPAPIDARADAAAYHEMDHSLVNQQFVDDLFKNGKVGPRVMDIGCGPADIPIRIGKRLSESEYGYAAAPWQIMAIDNEVEMLEIAKMEIEIAGLADRITLQFGDVTAFDIYDDGFADTVVSNTLVHHCSEPAQAIAELVRVTAPGGRMFIRDLVRPSTHEEIERLVGLHGEGESEYAQQLLRQSLLASLSLQETEEIIRGLGVEVHCVQMTSDRHWTIDWKRPE